MPLLNIQIVLITLNFIQSNKYYLSSTWVTRSAVMFQLHPKTSNKSTKFPPRSSSLTRRPNPANPIPKNIKPSPHQSSSHCHNFVMQFSKSTIGKVTLISHFRTLWKIVEPTEQQLNSTVWKWFLFWNARLSTLRNICRLAGQLNSVKCTKPMVRCSLVCL